MELSAITGEQWKIKFPILPVMLYVNFYLGSGPTLSTNPQEGHFPRNRIYVGSIDKQWQADLADMVGLQRDNNKNRYILTVIDVFSKYAWSVPVKTKMGHLFVTRSN